MSNSNFNPKTCYIEKNKANCEGTEIEVEVKGQVPEYGVVIIENNKIRYAIVLEDTEYIMNSKGEKKTQLVKMKL